MHEWVLCTATLNSVDIKTLYETLSSMKDCRKPHEMPKCNTSGWNSKQ
jgi:hypothetical protein